MQTKEYYESQIRFHEEEIRRNEERIRNSRQAIADNQRRVAELEREEQSDAFWDKYDPDGEVKGLVEHTIRRMEERPSMVHKHDRGSASTLISASRGRLSRNLERQFGEHQSVNLIQQALLFSCQNILRDDPTVPAPAWRNKVYSLLIKKQEERRAKEGA